MMVDIKPPVFSGTAYCSFKYFGNQETKNSDSNFHFLHFFFTDNLIETFKKKDTKIVLGFDHENYKHFSELTTNSKNELANDFQK